MLNKSRAQSLSKPIRPFINQDRQVRTPLLFLAAHRGYEIGAFLAVHFRVIVVTPDLKPYKGKADIKISVSKAIHGFVVDSDWSFGF